ncbi:MFS transporter [Xaviernesmea oryzae]|uniref:MFS transporter n=1 Tax=Xaviernesmea oryzae TaxID=464029 RepID=A0A1Q9B0F7_9HYPH|nr:multidrug effflux MFS transporter [Xaviernesmea oryzae]OLP61457.1 MFS transporter [Xaviernesmea oryzae]SEL68717.1 MFS transporter, DHA1 family, bicyclomycin/chloramphenicol resistance protein [Xaviernesmea oryzae]
MQPDPGFRERIALYALLTAMTSFSIDALLPGLRQLGAELGPAPPLSTQHVISLFKFGMVFGELWFGPLSDALGRRRSLIIGLCLYVAGSLIAMCAPSLPLLILGRVLQGIGVAGPKIATRAMIRDQFEGDAMAQVMSLMFTLFILVPMLAPVLAQGLIVHAGWRSLFAVYIGLAVLGGAWLLVRHPETLPRGRRIAFQPGLLWRNGKRILGCTRVTLLIAATGLVFGAQLLYLSIAPDLFFDLYGIGDRFPLYFAGLAAGLGLASFVNAALVRRFGMEAMAWVGFAGLVLSGMALLLATVLSAGRPSLGPFMGLMLCAFFAIGILFGNLNALALRSLGQIAGLGASLISAGSSLVSTLFAVALGRFYDGTAYGLAAGLTLAALGSSVLFGLSLHADASPVVPVQAGDVGRSAHPGNAA